MENLMAINFSALGGSSSGGTDAGWVVIDSFAITQNGKAAVVLEPATYWFQVQGTPSSAGTIAKPGLNGDFEVMVTLQLDSAGQSGSFVTVTETLTELLTAGIDGYVTIAKFDSEVSPVSFAATQTYGFGAPLSRGKSNDPVTMFSGWDHFQENATHIMLQRGNYVDNWQLIMNKETGHWTYPTYYQNGINTTVDQWAAGKTGLGRNVILQPNSTSNTSNFNRYTWDEEKNVYWREATGVDVNKTIPNQNNGYWFFAYDDTVGANGRFYNLSSNGNKILYSDNNGDTWVIGGTVVTGLSELSVAEDGTIFAKTNLATQAIYYSQDNGLTFTAFLAPLSAVWHRPVWNETGAFWTLSSTTQTGSVYTASVLGNTWTARTFTSTYPNAHPRYINGKTVVMFDHYTTVNKAVSATAADTWTVSPYVNGQNYIGQISGTSYGPQLTYVDRGQVKAWVDQHSFPALSFDPIDNRVHFAGPHNVANGSSANIAQSPDGKSILLIGDNVTWLSDDYGERWHAKYVGNYNFPIYFNGGFLAALNSNSQLYRFEPLANYQWSQTQYTKPSITQGFPATNGNIIVWGNGGGSTYNGFTTGGPLGTDIITSNIGQYDRPVFGEDGDAYIVLQGSIGLFRMDVLTGLATTEVFDLATGVLQWSGYASYFKYEGAIYGWSANNGYLIMKKITPNGYGPSVIVGDNVATDANFGITVSKGNWIVIDSQRNTSPYSSKRYLIQPGGSISKIITQEGPPLPVDDVSAKTYSMSRLGVYPASLLASLGNAEYCITDPNVPDFANDSFFQPAQLTSVKIVYKEA
jgi:hypothetical protein